MDVDDFPAAAGALEFWQAGDDTPPDPGALDAGPVAPGSSADTRARVHNAADGYTATAVSVSVGPPADPGTADLSPWWLVSADGELFATTCSIGDLGPGQTSEPFTLRRLTPPAGAPAAGEFTLTAAAGGWEPAAAATPTAAPGDALGTSEEQPHPEGALP